MTADTRRKVPRRYRLGGNRFEFRRIDGVLTETKTGLRVYCTARSCIYGQSPPPDHPGRVYLDTEGRPADEYSGWLLRRDMTNYLCVLLCRLAPEPQLKLPDEDDVEGWRRLLEENGLPLLGSEGWMPAEFGPTRPVDALPADRFDEVSPAQWRRAVIRRLSLFLGRPPGDELVRRMAGYFCRRRGWTGWMVDGALQPILDQVAGDERLFRLIDVIDRLTYRRAGIAQNREIASKPFRLRCPTPRGLFVFCFHPLLGRQGRRADHQLRVRRLLYDVAPLLVFQRWFQVRWLAAAVYLGRHYLEKPRRLARRRLTQELVAREFALSRRQLTYALQVLQQPNFAFKRFWEPYRRLRARQDVKR